MFTSFQTTGKTAPVDFASLVFFGKPRTGNYDPQIEARHRTHFNWGYPENNEN